MKDDRSYSDDLQKDAPQLAGLPKKQPADLPDGYFEGFSDKVLARIQAEESAGMQHDSEPPVVPAGWGKSYRYWAVAAMVVMAITAGLFLKNRMQVDPEGQDSDLQLELSLASLETEEIVGFLGQAEVSDEQLFAALGDTEDLELEGETHSSELIDYLDDQSIDELDLSGLDLDDVELL